MKLTQEQINILNSTGNIKINAVAGSGKTTTIIEYAKSRPAESRILYIAFNKAVKQEAERKFAQMLNVKVETAHSLAYKNIMYGSNFKIKNNGYNAHEIIKLLLIKSVGDKFSEYIIANHVLKLTAMFCNSSKLKVNELNYSETIYDDNTKKFVIQNFASIERYSREFLAAMNSGKIEITHDFYLKKYQLSKPTLNYDFILFDEGQDASEAMLDVFLNQNATKIIVGDEHQQIYHWRYAVNSLAKVDYPTFQLTQSFRFTNDIAQLAKNILDRKTTFDNSFTFNINGVSHNNSGKSKAIVARSNIMLLMKAIEYVTDKADIQKIYFEGNLNSYIYTENGTSLHDVLNLKNGKIHKINDPLLKSMHSINDLEEYIKLTDDNQMATMLDIVNEYGNDIFDIIKKIKDKNVAESERHLAQIVFSTVHKCKGMEYDTVQILNDFLNEKQLLSKVQNQDFDSAKIREEINLLYVAITRAKKTLLIPEELMPQNYPQSKSILVLKKESNNQSATKNAVIGYPKSKSAPSSKVVTDSIKTNWTSQQDRELKMLYYNGTTINDMSKHLGRNKGAIATRIKYLKLEVMH